MQMKVETLDYRLMCHGEYCSVHGTVTDVPQVEEIAAEGILLPSR